MAALLGGAVAQAQTEDGDRRAFSENSGRLMGQIVACGGHPRFVDVDRKVRERAWIGQMDPGPAVAAYLKAKRKGLDDQKTNRSGVSCDEVRSRFEDFSRWIAAAPADAGAPFAFP